MSVFTILGFGVSNAARTGFRQMVRPNYRLVVIGELALLRAESDPQSVMSLTYVLTHPKSTPLIRWIFSPEVDQYKTQLALIHCRCPESGKAMSFEAAIALAET